MARHWWSIPRTGMNGPAAIMSLFHYGPLQKSSLCAGEPGEGGEDGAVGIADRGLAQPGGEEIAAEQKNVEMQP